MIKENKKFEVKRRKGISKISIIGLLIVYSLFMLLFIISFFHTAFLKVGTFNSSKFWVPALTAVIIIFFLTFLSKKSCIDKWLEHLQNKNCLLIMTAFILFLLQIGMAFSLYVHIGWDVGFVIDSVNMLVKNPQSFCNSGRSSYFLIYPNNLFLLSLFYQIDKGLAAVGVSHFLIFEILLNTMIVNLSAWLTFGVIKKMTNFKTAILSLTFIIPFLIFSPWIIVPYSDTLSMIFPILIIYLYVQQKQIINEKHKIFLWIGIGFSACIGMFIKPTVIISVIAIFIIDFLTVASKKQLKRVLVSFVIVLGSTLCCNLLCNAFISNSVGRYIALKQKDKFSVPATHFIMMGMQEYKVNDGTTVYGAYLSDDVSFTLSKPTKDEKVKANCEEIKKRLKKFGICGYIKFIYNKANWILSDGTFWWGKEGSFLTTPFYAKAPLCVFLQQIFSNGQAKYYKYVNIIQGFWIAVQFLLIVPLFLAKKDYNNINSAVLRLTLIGIILFILLFEGRSRYLINHLPIFITLASYGIWSCRDFSIYDLKLFQKFKTERRYNHE